MQLLHKEFVQPLNVVIIVKTNLRPQARTHVVLFSSDLDLAYAPLVDYYGVRFHIDVACTHQTFRAEGDLFFQIHPAA